MTLSLLFLSTWQVCKFQNYSISTLSKLNQKQERKCHVKAGDVFVVEIRTKFCIYASSTGKSVLNQDSWFSCRIDTNLFWFSKLSCQFKIMFSTQIHYLKELFRWFKFIVYAESMLLSNQIGIAHQSVQFETFNEVSIKRKIFKYFQIFISIWQLISNLLTYF